MRCRYCGKELALLKRLTGGGGFCSEAHKQSYQDEYNQLALSRLLQAQKKDQTQPSGQTSGTPVAVEEPAVEEPVREADAAKAPVTESASGMGNNRAMRLWKPQRNPPPNPQKSRTS